MEANNSKRFDDSTEEIVEESTETKNLPKFMELDEETLSQLTKEDLKDIMLNHVAERYGSVAETSTELTDEDVLILKLNRARNELRNARGKVKEIESELRNNRNIRNRDYEYEVDEVELMKLQKNDTPVHGVNDLFRRVLKVKDINTGEYINLRLNGNSGENSVQVSSKIKTEGLYKIRQFCEIHIETPRRLYVKSLKGREGYGEKIYDVEHLKNTLESRKLLKQLQDIS